MICTKSIKCIYHEKGCLWTGTLGTNDRILNDHLEKCEWGGFESCSMCSKKIQKIFMDDHMTKCPENETECKYCHEKMKNKFLFLHIALGETNGRWCDNMCKCPYPDCDACIEK